MLKRAMLSAVVASGLLAAAAAGPADAAKRDTLRGKTHQGMRIKVAVMDRAIRVVRFNVDLECRDGSTLRIEESGFLKTPLRANGSFRDVQYGSTDTVYLRGKVLRGSVDGRLRVTDKYGGVRCQSRWVKFRVS